MIKSFSDLPVEIRQAYVRGALGRMCSLYGVAKPSQLARFFDFSETSPKNWLARGSVAPLLEWVVLAAADKQVSEHWILEGTDHSQIDQADLSLVKQAVQFGLLKAAKYNMVPKELLDDDQAARLEGIAELIVEMVEASLQRKLASEQVA